MRVGHKYTTGNRYSADSERELATCHADLQSIFRRVLPLMDHTVLVGRRGPADQQAAFRRGTSKARWPLSKHNCPLVPEASALVPRNQWFAILETSKWPEDLDTLSMAVDVAPYNPALGGVHWGNKGSSIQRQAALRGFVLLAGIALGTAAMLRDLGVIEHGLRWGGDWDSDKDLSDQTFDDLAHFELVKL